MEEYKYAIIIISTLLVNRYIIPFLDIISELFNYWTGYFANKLTIKTQREQMNFKKEMEENEVKADLMGFHYENDDFVPEVYDDEDESEDVEDDDGSDRIVGKKRKIGFRSKGNGGGNRRYSK